MEMRGSKRAAARRLAAIAGMASLAGLAGCSSALIETRPMAFEVVVLDADRVAGCQAKGGVRVSAAAYVWVFKRSDDDIEANLLQLARNGAIDAGGDALVKGDSPRAGERNFAIYKCRP